jgi:TetR/AcrR family acrAB operon transcriptional repressor
MARKTKEEAQNTRSLILDTAEIVFQRKGVSGTSLHEIAQSAGLTRGAIYWHFKDKADLFNAMLERVVLPLEQALQADPEARREDALAYLRHCALDAMHLVTRDEQARRVFEIATRKVEYVDELRGVRERHVASRTRCLDDIERDLRLAATQRGTQLSMPSRSAAVALHALIDGLIQNWILDPASFDLVTVGTQALDQFLAGLNLQAVPANVAARIAPARTARA